MYIYTYNETEKLLVWAYTHGPTDSGTKPQATLTKSVTLFSSLFNKELLEVCLM